MDPYSTNHEEALIALEKLKNKYRKYKSLYEDVQNGDYVQFGEMKGVYFVWKIY